MGGVNLAVSMGPGGFTKLLVVKRLRPEIADVPEFLSMFLQEAKLAARLNHPNVVQTYEINSDATSHFLTMEYLEGQSLHSILRAARHGAALGDSGAVMSEPVPLSGRSSVRPPPASSTRPPPASSTRPPPASSTRPPPPDHKVGETGSGGRGGLPLPLFLRVLCDALEGLHHAHELTDHDGRPLSIVHRDVSPGNIFVTYDGVVKLLDFGIAKAADSSLHTRTGMLKGKVAYMAPEQLRQGNRLDRRADIFALGAILWQAATGQRLWRGVSDLEILMRLSKGQLPRPSEVAPDVHPRLEAICAKAMAMDPAGRHATAAELRDDLETLLDEIGPATSRELGAYVSELFAAPRAAARTFLRRKLDELRSAPRADEVPSVRAPADSSRESARDDSRLGPLPLTISRPVQRETLPPPQGRRLAWGGLGAAAAGLAVAGVLVWSRRDRAPLPSPPSPPAVAPFASPSTAPASAIAHTRLTVAVSPADAHLFVDGVPVLINPYTTMVPADGRMHEVRAEAPGFVSQTRAVEFGPAGASVRFALEREGGGGRPAGPAPGAGEAPARGRPSAPPPKREEGRIDRGSPW